MLWQILCILIIITMVLRWKNRELRKIHEQLSTSIPSWPIFGHALAVMGNSRDLMLALEKIGREAIDRNGMVSAWILNKFVIIMVDAEATDVIFRNCLEKDNMMGVAKPLLGNASLIAPESIWRRRRKLVAPAFSLKTLITYVKIFSKQSEIMVDKLKTCGGKGKLSIHSYMVTCTMDCLCETTLGTEVKAQSYENHPVFLAYDGFFSVSAYRMVRPWLYIDAIHKLMPHYPIYKGYLKTITEFVDKIIGSCRQANVAKKNISVDQHHEPIRTRSFIDLIIQSGEKTLSNLELREESIQMFLAGTDTGANTASYAAILMAKYPEVQEKVHEEVLEVLGDSNRPIEADDLPKFRYLEVVIKETMRLYPSFPFVVRKVDKNVTLPSGITLVPGVGVVIHIWALHRNPKYWGSDADFFRPERFFDSPPTNTAAYIPFGSGPRNCIGLQYGMMAMKTILATLIREYRLLPVPTPDEDDRLNGSIKDKSEGLRTKFEIALKHFDNYEIKLEKRN